MPVTSIAAVTKELTARGGSGASATLASPSVVLLLTDDQDVLLSDAARWQPVLHRRVVQAGATFARAFANSPVCCPSRSSLLTGKYTHNHGALNNSLQGSCASPQWSTEMEPDALAVHMQKAGYRTMYAGKYLNNYGLSGSLGLKYVPPGWSEWCGLQGNSRYYNYTLSVNGREERHGCNASDYLTDVLAERAVAFVQRTSSPLFLWIGTPAAHASFTPAPPFVDTARGELAPRTPNWNVVGNRGHHQTVRELSPMSANEAKESDEIYRRRLGTLRSVDRLVESVFSALDATGRADATYFFYTSDHGFHLGQNGMAYDKRQLFETDVRVPLFVSGPGVPAGATLHQPVSHVDLAPTILALATGGALTPDGWDGTSYHSALLGAAGGGRKDVLLQYYGEGRQTETCGAHRLAYHTLADGTVVAWDVGEYEPAPCDGENNTWACVRRVVPSAAPGEVLAVDDVWCEFACFVAGPGTAPVPCPADEPEGYGAYYDLKADPWQVHNRARVLPHGERDALRKRLHELRACQGQAGCA